MALAFTYKPIPESTLSPSAESSGEGGRTGASNALFESPFVDQAIAFVDEAPSVFPDSGECPDMSGQAVVTQPLQGLATDFSFSCLELLTAFGGDL